MRKNLLLSMSALLRRPAASAFIQSFRSSPRMQSIRYMASETPHSLQRSAVIFGSMGCTAQRGAPLNLLSKGFSTDIKNDDRSSSIQQSSDGENDFLQPIFKKGDQIMVEVIFFGPLGASVDVVAHDTHDPSECIPQDEPALGRGMILQREIDYFRRGRGGIDVVKYEILPAYVENVREEEFEDEDGELEVRLDISLRPPGGKKKAEELAEQVLQKLKDSDGVLDVGDKSSPGEINEVFPGASKSAFKKAVSGLYRRGLVSPGPNSISLM